LGVSVQVSRQSYSQAKLFVLSASNPAISVNVEAIIFQNQKLEAVGRQQIKAKLIIELALIATPKTTGRGPFIEKCDLFTMLALVVFDNKPFGRVKRIHWQPRYLSSFQAGQPDKEIKPMLPAGSHPKQPVADIQNVFFVRGHTANTRLSCDQISANQL